MIARASGRCLLLAAIVLIASWTGGRANCRTQEQTGPTSQQVLSGKIKVNGKRVPPGFAIASGDTVETAKGSSAVVSLGKLGRVEVFPTSEMKVTFDDSNITISLEAGGARLSKSEGSSATVSTKHGEVVASTPLEGSFTVDTSCGNTVVTAHTAAVELRAGGQTQMISPGSHASAGQPRPGCKSKPAKTSSVK